MARSHPKGTFGPILGYLLGAVVCVFLLWLSYDFGPSWRFNYLILIGGGLFGWIAGLLLSPTTRGERAQFSEYGKALSTFVSGFLVAKLDKLFELTVKGASDVNEIFVGRLILFASAVALGTLMTFIWRRYVSVKV